ncbi:MAG: MFS transporter [Spirochaetales bacterium]|nr:MFS transporter [Spirochaetales bacterium]
MSWAHRWFAPSWMNRDIARVLIAHALMSATQAMAAILVPIDLAKLGFHGVFIGLLFTATATASAVLTAVIGFLSDRFGRRSFLVLMPFVTAVAGFIFALSQWGAFLFVSAAIGALGRGSGAGGGTVGPYQPAEQAYLTARIPSEHRNSLFGRLGFATSLGALIGGGPLIYLTVGLTPHAQQFTVAFFVAGACALAAGVLALGIAKDRKIPLEKSQVSPVNKDSAKVLPPGQVRRLLLQLAVTNSLNGFAVGFFGPFITYWFYRRFGVSAVEIGLLYMLINVVSLFSNVFTSRVALRWGVVRSIVVTRIVQGLMIIPMVLAPFFWLAGVLYALRMMVQRLGLPLRQSYVMGIVPDAQRGKVSSLSNLPSQVTSAISPSLAGPMIENISLNLPFELGALIQTLGAILFGVFFGSTRPPEERLVPPKEQAPGGDDPSES